MTLWTAQEAAIATGGRVQGNWAARGVSIDTRTLQPGDREIMWVLRVSIVVVASLASLIAIQVNSVYGLFYLCGDLVYVLLFPQLTLVLYYKRGNAYGALCGYIIGSILRLTGGEPLLNFDPIIYYPNFDEESGYQYFPFKTMAMTVTFVSIILFSEIAILLSQIVKRRCGYNKWDFMGAFEATDENKAVENGRSYYLTEVRNGHGKEQQVPLKNGHDSDRQPHLSGNGYSKNSSHV